jgi:7-cyano-7-deazaguanine synthase in queuosine biosynthesis
MLLNDSIPIKKNKSLLLFSGGLDSTCIAALEKPDYLLFIDHNAESQKKDSANIKSFYSKYKDTVFPGSELIVNKGSIDLSEWELSDAKILLRNLFLINVAALYAENIMLGVVLGDRNKDKDSIFCKKAQDTLNYCMQSQHWVDGFNYSVTCKYEFTSKSQLVEMYLKSGFDKQALLDSTSCYKNYENNCGQCKPCLRKKEALEFNGIFI